MGFLVLFFLNAIVIQVYRRIFRKKIFNNLPVFPSAWQSLLTFCYFLQILVFCICVCVHAAVHDCNCAGLQAVSVFRSGFGCSYFFINSLCNHKKVIYFDTSVASSFLMLKIKFWKISLYINIWQCLQSFPLASFLEVELLIEWIWTFKILLHN